MQLHMDGSCNHWFVLVNLVNVQCIPGHVGLEAYTEADLEDLKLREALH